VRSLAIGSANPPIHAPAAPDGTILAKQVLKRGPQIGSEWANRELHAAFALIVFDSRSYHHQLVDLSDTLGSSGTMLFGGEITDRAWREARWSFIHGNFAATVLICQGLAEHLLGSYLHCDGNLD
jgi:hypothetical protein